MQQSYSIECKRCHGSGLIKKDPIPCIHCKGKICFICEKKGGFKIKSYETCDYCNDCNDCNGSGYFNNHQLSSRSSR